MTDYVGPHGQALLDAMAAAPRPSLVQAEMGATIRTLEARAADLEAEVRSMQRRLSEQTRQLLRFRAQRDALRAGLQDLVKVIADHGDGYVHPEAEQAALKVLKDTE